MALAFVHFARWLAWQVSHPEPEGPERPASITVFSGRAAETD
jgi:hypothetical protein